MSAADILTGAATLIEARGKCVREYRDDDGRLCTVGAMREVAFGNALTAPTHHGVDVAAREHYLTAHRAMHLHIGDRSVTNWSDEHPAEVVVAALRTAAAGLAPAGGRS
ncbi:hypothetical protein AB0N38_18935 [Micromonospora aurantiaca]|uniref:DUF6197 family protein n=1 Tax=Micromonospora aurantiaca (nom. illeg.) TaxID=47850 RepID=UPI003442C0D1